MLIGFCQDNLTDQKHLDNLKTLWGISSDMSFDVLQSVVEELNRYPNADFVDLIGNMNISLGDALNRRFEMSKAMLGSEELKPYHGTATAVINMVSFQEGTYALNVPVRVDKFYDQKDLYEALGASNCYFYNKDVLVEIAEGKIEDTSEQALSESIDEEFVMIFRFNPATDRILGDTLVFTRDIKGRELSVTYKLTKEDTMMEYFRLLFK